MDIDLVLNSSCPFWPGSKVKDTHLLVLVPKMVSGRPFTLNFLGELIKNPNMRGYGAKYRTYGSAVQRELGGGSPNRSYWVLMTRDVLPGSRGMSHEDHEELVSAHVQRTDLPYGMPRTLEAATAILLHYAHTGKRLYTDNPHTYTRCRERVYSYPGEYPVVVGGFSPRGSMLTASSTSFTSVRALVCRVSEGSKHLICLALLLSCMRTLGPSIFLHYLISVPLGAGSAPNRWLGIRLLPACCEVGKYPELIPFRWA